MKHRKLCGISSSYYESNWSLSTVGQKTRLQLVLQLAPKADVRVLDELTRDLDALARHRVLEFLKRDAATCLYATHVFQGLDGWATDVLRVRRGSCVVEEASSVDVAGIFLPCVVRRRICLIWNHKQIESGQYFVE